MAKALNFAEIAEIILEKNLPIAFFVFRKEQGYSDFPIMFNRDRKAEGAPMEYSRSTLSKKLGLSESIAYTNFKTSRDIMIPITIAYLATINGKKFRAHNSFFEKRLVSISMNRSTLGRQKLQKKADKFVSSLPITKEMLEAFLKKSSEYVLAEYELITGEEPPTYTARENLINLSGKDWINKYLEEYKKRLKKLHKELKKEEKARKKKAEKEARRKKAKKK